MHKQIPSLALMQHFYRSVTFPVNWIIAIKDLCLHRDDTSSFSWSFSCYYCSDPSVEGQYLSAPHVLTPPHVHMVMKAEKSTKSTVFLERKEAKMLICRKPAFIVT